MGTLFTWANEIFRLLDLEKVSKSSALTAIDVISKIDSILGVVGFNTEVLSDDVELLIEERNKARQEKNWEKADNIRKELESLLCGNCEKVKINLKIFPKTPPEPFWTNDKNFWQPKFNWIVNFLNGNTFGRYPGYKPNYIRLIRDRN